jgi:4a-hydroxytetrahydrobiopterin dehydratase
MEELKNKTCVPCRGDMPALSTEKCVELLKYVNNVNNINNINNGWHLNEKGHLYKEFTLAGFQEPMDLANKIAEISNQEDHHPNLFISWKKLGVEIWTHIISGLTENDFILASKINEIA